MLAIWFQQLHYTSKYLSYVVPNTTTEKAHRDTCAVICCSGFQRSKLAKINYLYRAMAFLKLVNDVDGTAVRDGTHDLVVRVILLQVSHNFLNQAYSILYGTTQ